MKQHVISKTYLEQFSFIHKGDGKQICIKYADKSRTTRRYIKSFNRYVDFFDVVSDNPELVRAFESHGQTIETHYPQIIEQLENTKSLSDNYSSYLLQYSANLISRSNYWRYNIKTVLNSEHKLTFIKHTLRHVMETEEDIIAIENNELLKLPTEELLNWVIPNFDDHLWFNLCVFEIVFLKAPDARGWFTSDNPVAILKASERNNILSKLLSFISKPLKKPEDFLSNAETISEKTEIYFPLSSKYLAFIYHPKLKSSTNKLRLLKSNSINEISVSVFDNITEIIIKNSYEYLICPFDIEYDTNKRTNEI